MTTFEEQPDMRTVVNGLIAAAAAIDSHLDGLSAAVSDFIELAAQIKVLAVDDVSLGVASVNVERRGTSLRDDLINDVSRAFEGAPSSPRFWESRPAVMSGLQFDLAGLVDVDERSAS